MKATAAFAVAACIASATPSKAQPAARLPRSAEAIGAAAIAERNQLGLLEYCETAGHITAEAVIRQRKFLAALLPNADHALGATEETSGRNGLIAFEESRISLAADAAAQGITVSYSCFQLATRVLGAP